MPLDYSGVKEVVQVVDTVDLPATTDLRKEINITKERDFYVNNIVLDYLFQGATDEPTEAEKLVKLGTCNIVTKSSLGKWGTDLDFDDLYYRYLARLRNGHKSFLIGDGGGDDDYHGMRIVLDAGGGKYINNTFAWRPDDEAILKILYGSDVGLDNSKLRYTINGYHGSPPKAVASIENREVTFGAKGNLEKFSVNKGEILQELFAFLTTELNLATIQDTSVYGIQHVELRHNDQENQKEIIAYVNQMIDGIDDDAEGNLQQYVRKMFDPMWQGLGLGLKDNDKIAFVAGVAEATRMYVTKIQKYGGFV